MDPVVILRVLSSSVAPLTISERTSSSVNGSRPSSGSCLTTTTSEASLTLEKSTRLCPACRMIAKAPRMSRQMTAIVPGTPPLTAT